MRAVKKYFAVMEVRTSLFIADLFGKGIVSYYPDVS